MISVGEALRQVRAESDMTIVEVCEKAALQGIKISRSALACYERGERVIPKEKLEALCKVYGDDLPVLVHNALSMKKKFGEHSNGFTGVLSECPLQSVAGYLYQYYGREVFSQLLDEMQRVKDVSI